MLQLQLLQVHIKMYLVAAMAATAYCGYGLLGKFVGGSLATALSILLAAAVYGILLLSLEVVRREEIRQLPKGEKLAKFLFKS